MSGTFLDGRPATAEDLRALALVNDGHFTSMQMRGRAVRGLDLHLQRLASATRELFDTALEHARVRDAILAAADADGVEDASVRVTVFPHGVDLGHRDQRQSIGLLVTLAPPRNADATPLRVKACRFERPLPHIKHVGTFPQFQLRRLARRAGFDDALFVDGEGRISEGATWNIGFWDGSQVLWPQAGALRGTTERLLQAGLDGIGLPQRHRPVEHAAVGGLRAAFAANAVGVQAIAGIDDTILGPDPELMRHLVSALEAAPWQRVQAT